MKRKIDEKLDKWVQFMNNNILVLYGANNIGKFYSANQLAERRFKNKIIYDFSKEHVKNLFKILLNKEDLVSLISDKFEKTNLLIIMKDMDLFSEFKVLLSLLTELQEYKFVVTMNKLGDINVNDCELKNVSFLKMGMMDFEEYLWASKDEYLASQIRQHFENFLPIEESLHKKSLMRFWKYLSIGGYPLVILNHIKGEDLIGLNEMRNFHQNDIIGQLIKNESSNDALRMLSVYDTLLQQLLRANKKFQFSLIRKGATIVNYCEEINKLLDYGLVVESSLFNSIGDDTNLELGFKLYYGEIGLFYNKLLNEYGLEFLSMPANFKESIIENYIAIQLKLNGYKVCYWESGNTAKIEFVISKDNKIIPIEMMLEYNPKSKNMQMYKDKNRPEISYRIANDNFSVKDNIFTIPVYSVFCI